MTFSVSAPTNNTGALLNNGTEVLSVESDNSIDIDSGTLHVDATNNRVGIGTSSPMVALNIHDSTNARLALTNSSTGQTFPDGFELLATGLDAYVMNRSNGNMFFTTNNTNRMVINSSGNVGIGTNSPSGDGPLSIERNGNASTELNLSLINGISNKECILNFGSNLTTSDRYKGRIFYQTDNNVMGFWTNKTERMRIDSAGNLTVGPTFAAGTNSVKIAPVGDNVPWYSSRSTTATANQMLFYNPNGIVGSIQTTNSSTAFNTSSDYRLKENVAPMSGSIDRVKQLKPSTWSWKVDGSYGEGFIAHEAQEVVPEAVGGTKDAMRTEEYEVTPAVLDNDGNIVTEAVMGTREVPDYQGIDQSKLVPLLTAALQEAITKIESLEARIQALESN
jgi:hypothetical protein